MRAKAPATFEACFKGPEGRYCIRYALIDDWDGSIAVSIAGIKLAWPVETVEKEGDLVRICGLTHGTRELWGDVFWFELICRTDPECIRYWADRKIWRQDQVEAKDH
jgi:hypothetical protein